MRAGVARRPRQSSPFLTSTRRGPGACVPVVEDISSGSDQGGSRRARTAGNRQHVAALHVCSRVRSFLTGVGRKVRRSDDEPPGGVAAERPGADPLQGGGDGGAGGARDCARASGPWWSGTAGSPSRSSCATSTSTRPRSSSTASACSSWSATSRRRVCCDSPTPPSRSTWSWSGSATTPRASPARRSSSPRSTCQLPLDRIQQVVDVAVPMMHDAVQAFVHQDCRAGPPDRRAG